MDEALLRLLEKKDFEFITVKELCAAAKVNRSRFYLHYENIYELLAESVDTLNRRFFADFVAFSRAGRRTRLPHGILRERAFRRGDALGDIRL